jgi:hypothetical protein
MANTFTVAPLIGPFEAKPVIAVVDVGWVTTGGAGVSLLFLPQPDSASTAIHKNEMLKLFIFMALSFSFPGIRATEDRRIKYTFLFSIISSLL